MLLSVGPRETDKWFITGVSSRMNVQVSLLEEALAASRNQAFVSLLLLQHLLELILLALSWAPCLACRQHPVYTHGR
jgi:hypothetical protein